MADHHSTTIDSITVPVRLPVVAVTDVGIVLSLAAAALLSMYLPVVDRSIIRLGLALVLFLLLPGYALIAAVFPGRNGPGMIERMALSAGMSLVISPLLGYGLNYTPIGVRQLPFALSVAAFTCLFMAIAARRRRSLPADEQYRYDIAMRLNGAWQALRPGDKKGQEKTAAIMVLASLALAVVTISLVAAVPLQHEKYTELWLYGKNGTIAEYPLNFTLGETRPVIVGIANHEGSAMAYNLAVTLAGGNGTQGQTLYSDHIVLKDNQTLERAINLTPDRAGERMNMLFQLYLDGMPDAPYRVCNLWVNVSQPADGTAAVQAP